MGEITEQYFKNDADWLAWLAENHCIAKGVYLIFYAVAHENQSMRWEEALRVAICYG